MRVRRASSQVVGNGELARMYDRSPEWARGLLLEWYEEQREGGEVRVIARRDRRGRLILETTRGALMRSMPPCRDLVLVRKVDGIDRDLDHLARRIDRLTREKETLEARLFKVEASQRAVARRG